MILFEVLVSLVFFICFVFLGFYLPGKLLLLKLSAKLSFLEDVFFSFTVGILIFTLISFILAWINAYLVFLLLLICLLVYILKRKVIKIQQITKEEKIALLIILVLSLIFSFVMFSNGRFGDYVRLSGVNSSDGMWHIGLINEIKVHFPPQFPGISGIRLSNYNFFYDFLLAQSSKVSFISPFYLYFQFFPLLIALLWGMGVYVFLQRWINNKIISYLSLFLSFFGGSFGFILSLQGFKNINLNDVFGMTQPVGSLLNPMFAISIPFVILSLFSYLMYFKTKNNLWIFPIALAASLTPLFKVYAGIILLGSFVVFMCVQLFKRQYGSLLYLPLVGVLFYFTYYIFAGKAGGLVFAPLWAPHKVLVDNLPWYGYEEKMYTYQKLHVLKGIIQTELYGLSAYIVGSLGARVLGIILLPLFYLIKVKNFTYLSLIFTTMFLISILLPLFFIQSLKVFETTQFTWYFLFFSSILGAIGIGKLLSLRFSRYLKALIIVFVVLLNLPTDIFTLNIHGIIDYKANLYSQPIKFLNMDTNYVTVLEIPPSSVQADEKDIYNWYVDSSRPLKYSMSYKSAFLYSPSTIFPGTEQTTKERISLLKNLMLLSIPTKDNGYFDTIIKQTKKGLDSYRIYYIYAPQEYTNLEKISGVVKVFRGDKVNIYKVNHEI